MRYPTKSPVTHQSAPNEEYGDRNMLHVPCLPLAAPAAHMFQEDVGRAIEKDEGALDELCRRAPFLVLSSRTDIPGPTQVAKATGPSAQSKQSKPEEDAAFDPMRQPIEKMIPFLKLMLVDAISNLG